MADQPVFQSLRLAGILTLRATLVVMVTVACAVDQPLPPPNNPGSVVTACTLNEQCGDGKVCHRAVAGGACIAACTNDAACAGIQTGLVCHPAMNAGTCAPDCSVEVQGKIGNGICAAYGPNIECQAGRCVPVPAPTAAKLRLFNSLSEKPVVSLGLEGLDQAVVEQVATGDLQPQAAGNVPAGNVKLRLHEGASLAGSVLAESALSLSPGHSYVIVAHELLAGTPTLIAIDEDASVEAPAGQALLNVAHTAPGIGGQDVRFAIADSSPGTLFGAVEFRTGRQAFVPAGSGTLQVAPALAARPTMFAETTLVANGRYTLLIIGGRAQTFVESVLITTTGIVARAPTAAFRLANATFDVNQFFVALDDDSVETTRSAGPQTLGPAAGGFVLISPGQHRVRLFDDVLFGTTVYDQTLNFTAKHAYALVAHGTLADGAKPLGGSLVDFEPATLGAGQASARFFHAVTAQLGATTDVTQTIGSNPPASLTTGLAYGSASTVQAISAGETFSWGYSFASGSPTSLASQNISVAPGSSLICIASGDGSAFSVWTMDLRGTVNVSPTP